MGRALLKKLSGKRLEAQHVAFILLFREALEGIEKTDPADLGKCSTRFSTRILNGLL